jgi:integrase
MVGGYQYIKNGVEKINTLADADNLSIGYDASIWGSSIHNNCFYLPVEDCVDGEKRLDLSLEDVITENHFADLILHKRIINGNQAINAKIVFGFSGQDYPNVPISVRGSKQKIDFIKYESIPAQIIIELKCIMMFIMLTPDIFVNNRKKNKKNSVSRLAAHTVIGHMKSGLLLLNTLFSNLEKTFGKEHIHNQIHSLCSITENFYRDAAEIHEYSYHDDLKQFISYLHNPFTSNDILGDKVPSFDPDTFDWKVTPVKRTKEKVISNREFEKLVRTASMLVADFLTTLGHEVTDKTVKKYLKSNTKSDCLKAYLNKDTFKYYQVTRLSQADYSNDLIENICGIPREMINSNNRLSVSYMSNFISNKTGENIVFQKIWHHINIVGAAAKYIIAQYTAMRPDDLAHLHLDNCLTKETGHYLIKGNVSKGTDNLVKGLFDDKWVTIPIMIDAIKVLEVLSSITQRKLLFSATTVKRSNQKEIEQNPGTIAYQIRTFINHVLPNNSLQFNNYMLRHTLAYQLFRVEAGLPVISFHLKHLVNTVDKYLSKGATSDVTLGYGGIGDILVVNQNAQKFRKKAEIENVKSTVDPDAVYLGGKAKEHKENMKALFEGYMAAGYSKDDIFEAMAEQGIGVINVGLGYCYGMSEIDADLPCIGSLKCNPIRCSNAIVGKANEPHWRDIYLTNKANLNNPIYGDNYSQIREVMEEAESVLRYLNEEVINVSTI